MWAYVLSETGAYRHVVVSVFVFFWGDLLNLCHQMKPFFIHFLWKVISQGTSWGPILLETEAFLLHHMRPEKACTSESRRSSCSHGVIFFGMNSDGRKPLLFVGAPGCFSNGTY